MPKIFHLRKWGIFAALDDTVVLNSAA